MTDKEEAEEGCISEEEGAYFTHTTHASNQATSEVDDLVAKGSGAGETLSAATDNVLPYETGASQLSPKHPARRGGQGSPGVKTTNHRHHYSSSRQTNRHHQDTLTSLETDPETVPSTDVLGHCSTSTDNGTPTTSLAVPQAPPLPSKEIAFHSPSLTHGSHSLLSPSTGGYGLTSLPSFITGDSAAIGNFSPVGTAVPMWRAASQPMMVFVPTMQGDGSMALLPTWTTPAPLSTTTSVAPLDPLQFRHPENADAHTMGGAQRATKMQTISRLNHFVRLGAASEHFTQQFDVQGHQRPPPPPPPPPPPLVDPYATVSFTGPLGGVKTDTKMLIAQSGSHKSTYQKGGHPLLPHRPSYSSAPYCPSASPYNDRTSGSSFSWVSTEVSSCHGSERPPTSSPMRSYGTLAQETHIKPPPPPINSEPTSRQNRSNEFHCTVCDREFRHKSRYDLHLIEDHVPCDQCDWTGPPTMLLAHNLTHLRGKDGEVICASKAEEETWIAARRKKREVKRQGGDPRSVKVPMSALETALREALKVKKPQKLRLSANILRRHSKDSGVLPQAHAYTRMFHAKRTETYEGPEVARTDQCRIWQEFNICHSFLRHKKCKFGRSCSRSHDIKRYQDWYLNRIKSGIQVKFRHYNAKALLYTLAAPEIAKYESVLLKCFKVLVSNRFWITETGGSRRLPQGEEMVEVKSVETGSLDMDNTAAHQSDSFESDSGTGSVDSLASTPLFKAPATFASAVVPSIPISCGSPSSAASSSSLMRSTP